MGNSAGRESRSTSNSSTLRSPTSPSFPGSPSAPPPASSERSGSTVYNSRTSRGSRHDLSLFGLGGGSDRDAALEPRRETRQEREARKLDKERAARARERERSMREEGVDGGYLVTLGTYVGPEDFSKSTVRHLQIERRLAPFWKGLNDHSSSWTEHQLVAAARGQPIPAPDEIPPHDDPPTPATELDRHFGLSSGLHSRSKNSTSPVPVRSDASSRHAEAAAPSSLPTFHFSGDGDGAGSFPSNGAPGPLFRGRAKTFASLTSPKNNGQPAELGPPEIRLKHDPQINGQPIEAFLYKDVAECPICFLYYPTYLNQTRCCEQPICSECFVQIKRPDPHPPEHTDPSEPAPANPAARSLEDESQLVSEPATCPFCVQPEFGVTYEPPPFRRGLAYGQHGHDRNTAMTSSTSLSNQGNQLQQTRRRGQSLSASNSTVITTDKIRPDWAKKLADARGQAARRSAAATALHTAAYMMGNSGSGSSFASLGRRRRVMMEGVGSHSLNPSHTRLEQMSPEHVEQMLLFLGGQESSRRERRGGGNGGSNDLLPSRMSSRGSRTEDLEEIMMMEAIRQSLAAEEERKKKEDKDAAKEAKKEEKRKAKEQKKADKAARKAGGTPAEYSSSRNNSGFFSSISSATTGGTSAALGPNLSLDSATEGKGKSKASSREASRTRRPAPLGFTALDEPSSVLHNQSFTAARSDPQRHLEQSRANVGSTAPPPPAPLQKTQSANSSSTTSSGSSAHTPQPQHISAQQAESTQTTNHDENVSRSAM